MLTFIAALLIGTPSAHADTWTVDGVDYPSCVYEDGSGGPTPCVWTNDGRQWLTFPDHSVLIVGSPLEILIGTPPVPVTIHDDWTDLMLP